MVISNFLMLPSVFVVFSRLDSFFTISTQRNLYASRLFLVSLVPWIDKPWGNTLREKLHEPCTCGIQIGGAKERQHRAFDLDLLEKTGMDVDFARVWHAAGCDGFVPVEENGSRLLTI